MSKVRNRWEAINNKFTSAFSEISGEFNELLTEIMDDGKVPGTKLDTENENSVWNVKYWEKQGFTRPAGNPPKNSEYYEVLQKMSDKMTQYVILCPTFANQPLQLNCYGAIVVSN